MVGDRRQLSEHSILYPSKILSDRSGGKGKNLRERRNRGFFNPIDLILCKI